ncbi:ABC transporter substrate-binding protein [Paenibacillus sp. TRM 82003]|nr:ABC transporter substrate-binding protein [Paenibacillus sp. TRM 82003]
MNKFKFFLCMLGLAVALTACGGQDVAEEAAPAAAPAVQEKPETKTATEETQETEGTEEPAPAAEPADNAAPATKTVSYLDQSYELPATADRLVITGAVEAMEDAIVLDIHPVGAITFSGAFPSLFAPITDAAVSIGEKAEPNFETILSLKPDVIIGTTKFKPEVAEQLKKIAPTIPYSHVATNWEANLTLLGELSGKQEEAKQAIEKYYADLEQAKLRLEWKDRKVAAVRIRNGEVYIYPQNVFFNPSLYGDLGLTVPDEVKAAKAQELISIEKFAEMNPDALFVQFSKDENKNHPNALEELQNNPILKNVNAFKNKKTFVNVVDPLAQGGTAYSKIEFLKAAVSSLSP